MLALMCYYMRLFYYIIIYFKRKTKSGLQQVIFNMLVEHGVDTVFGYSGGGGTKGLQIGFSRHDFLRIQMAVVVMQGAVLPLIDAFHGKNIKWITSAHEQLPA